MKELTLDRIARMTEGRIYFGKGTEKFTSVAVDSRLVKPGGIFFALKGEVTDGHRFIEGAVKNGAELVITDHECETFGACGIVCDDTFRALQMLAASYRDMFEIPFVCITGSSGKTTTKDLIASVLSSRYCVMKTKGNLNSTTGVPLTLFDLSDEHEIAVIEVSMSAPGEILGNARIVRPDTAVITNIGTAHIEFLGSRENIFRAKSEILTYLHDGNLAVVNGEDDFLSTISGTPYGVIKVACEGGDLSAYDILQKRDRLSFTCDINGVPHRFSFGYVGHHNVINCLSAIAVGIRYGLTAEQIQKGFDRFSPSSNRMQVEEAGGMVLINDSYNANEEAFEAAMDYLVNRADGRKVVVAGDMYELGEFSGELHEKTGRKAAALGVDLFVTFGEFSGNYAEGYREGGGRECVIYSGKEELTEGLKNLLKTGDTVLFKASRGVKLEEVFLRLKEHLNK